MDEHDDTAERRRRPSGGVLAALVVIVLGTGAGVALALRTQGGPASPARSAAARPPFPRLPRRAAPSAPPLRSHPHLSEPVAGVTPGSPPSRGPASDLPSSSDPTARAPSDAEIRNEVRQLEAYYAAQPDLTAQLTHQLLPSAAFVGLTGWHTSIASTFFDYGLPIACGGTLAENRLGVAHRSLPCGTLVTFRLGNRAIRVPVVDRGPYIRGREWDLTGATAIALHFNGLGPIQWTLDAPRSGH